MRKQVRYGDDETMVTRSQEVVAILFVVGITALIVGTAWTARDDTLETVTRAEVALHVLPDPVPAEHGDDPAPSKDLTRGAPP